MRRTTLGRTDIEVSELCLGSMTWGTQNTEAEGHAQIDYALDHGVDFIDTAEMYPVNPISAETVGRTEEIIGSWIARTGRRNDVVIATKVSAKGMKIVRDGAPITPESLTEALEGSLRRLQTDVIDLYQLHWPNRGSYHFRQNWTYDPSGQSRDEVVADIDAVLECLAGHVKAGRIRAIGLSNETAWGTALWLQRAEAAGLPRVATIQNEYSLLCRTFDLDLGELSHHEDVTLLAFSPIATGLLTGKYQNGAIPPGSRMSLSEGLGGRRTPRAFEAVAAYLDLADKYNLALPQLAIAWCLTRPFPTIPIFGATSEAQLDVALGASKLTLGDDLLHEISEVHRAHPMPY